MFFQKKPKYSTESIFMVVCSVFMVAFVGSMLTDIGVWYANLPKIQLQPPNWVFGPAWTLLFILIAWSAIIIANSKSSQKKITLFIFGVNGVLNVLWSYLFFTLKNIPKSFAEITLLLASILLMIYFSLKVSKKAAVLLVPYLLWVSFATYLTYSYWIATM